MYQVRPFPFAFAGIRGNQAFEEFKNAKRETLKNAAANLMKEIDSTEPESDQSMFQEMVQLLSMEDTFGGPRSTREKRRNERRGLSGNCYPYELLEKPFAESVLSERQRRCRAVCTITWYAMGSKKNAQRWIEYERNGRVIRMLVCRGSANTPAKNGAKKKAR